MNVDEAKSILMLYRPGTADELDPQVAEALSLAKADAGLGRWLQTHCARYQATREKFLQITAPPGLKEQIISEHAATKRAKATRKMAWLAAAAVLLLLGVIAGLLHPQSSTEVGPLASYQNEMVRAALGGYSMDLMTNDFTPIHAYLTQNHAPADFTLPGHLQQATMTGCAVRDYEGAKVSLICFRTGRPLPPGQSNDLWLFVVERSAFQSASPTATRQIANVNRLVTATWTDGDKLYFLAIDGNSENLKRFL